MLCGWYTRGLVGVLVGIRATSDTHVERAAIMGEPRGPGPTGVTKSWEPVNIVMSGIMSPPIHMPFRENDACAGPRMEDTLGQLRFVVWFADGSL